MHPAATLFLDVCVQSDLWPGGVWPLVKPAQAANIVRLFVVAETLGLRQGGVVCHHVAIGSEPDSGLPAHGRHAPAGTRPEGCLPMLPMQVRTANSADVLDRAHALYVDSGCKQAPDDAPGHRRAFEHLTAGVRDAVVFGAGVEQGLDRAVDALLRRRIRTHVVLDAVSAADEDLAQRIVAGWKRRGMDGVTVETVERLLRRG